MASTHEDIMAVYQDDIDKMSYIVESKFGKNPFYENLKGMQKRKNTDYDAAEVNHHKAK